MSVDVAAPGTVIQSTSKNGTYAMLSGTSLAAPHVTGLAALLAAAKPGITVAEIRGAILGTATPLAALAGKVATGRLNAFAALGSLASRTSRRPRRRCRSWCRLRSSLPRQRTAFVSARAGEQLRGDSFGLSRQRTVHAYRKPIQAPPARAGGMARECP
jgi:subtilisin family serine protease